MKLWWLLNNIRNSFVFYWKKHSIHSLVWHEGNELTEFFIFGWSIPLMWNEDMSLSENIHNITSAKCFCKETETPSVLMRIGSESHNIKCTVTDVWAFTHSRGLRSRENETELGILHKYITIPNWVVLPDEENSVLIAVFIVCVFPTCIIMIIALYCYLHLQCMKELFSYNMQYLKALMFLGLFGQNWPKKN